MSIFNNFYTLKNTSKVISFEGIEGSGKSTQIKKLEDYLISRKFKVKVLREPGSTPWGEIIRNSILQNKNKVNPLSTFYAFLSARVEMLDQLLKNTNHFDYFLIDRYIDSSIAYQGFGSNIGHEKIIKIHEISPLNLLPHKTFYLNISMNTSMTRQKKRNSPKDFFEKKNESFFQKVIAGYDFILKNDDSMRVVDINAEFDEKLVFDQVLKHFLELQ